MTIGMATYDDFDGVFFSIQALRMYHEPCIDGKVEFVVLDGNPNSEHGKACKGFVMGAAGGKYVPYEGTPSSFNKYKIAEHATSKYVLIMDCHVLVEPGGIQRLLEYFESNPNCRDLIQGPLWYDDLRNVSTNFDPVWRGDMYGIWATNGEAYKAGLPFEIPMQGMGLLAFEREFWPGIGQHFVGFGAEEGYIAEKFRLNGGRNICLPGLRWNHRFGRPNGVKYPLRLEDRIWNYIVGWMELHKDPDHKVIKETLENFKAKVDIKIMQDMVDKAKAIYCPTRIDRLGEHPPESIHASVAVGSSPMPDDVRDDREARGNVQCHQEQPQVERDHSLFQREDR